MGLVGSPRKFTFDGVPFVIAGDADIAQNDRVEIEEVPHSGGNMPKVTTVGGSAEGVKLILAPSEYVVLKALKDAALLTFNGGVTGVPMSYEEADGTVNRTTGTISLGPRQTAEGSCEVKMMTSTGVWVPFTAS
jgi:hypothetical protein